MKDEHILIRVETKKNRVVYLEGFVSVKIHQNKPIYTRGIFRDISFRIANESRLRHVNEELKERQYNMEQLLYHAPDAIIVINSESIIRHWNPKAEEIFGWKNQEVIGSKLSNTIIPQQYREAHERGMQRFLSTGEAIVLNKTIELTALDKAGREFYISLTISTTQQKGERAFIAFIRDIDKQKRTELELEKKRLELEISNRQLEEFAHIASHDMKEPVRKILVFSQILESEAGTLLSENQMKAITKINSAATRLKKMVEGVLSYSSINVTVKTDEAVNLANILNHVQDDLEMVIAEKNPLIDYKDLPVIRGSAFLIQQLFYNLMVNSLKFSRPGIRPEICITSTIEETFENGGNRFCKIFLADNGIGFDNKDAERIFNKFTRLNPLSEYEGTGIGLALCRKIAEHHGGSIEARGKYGEGATFIIRLPEYRI